MSLIGARFRVVPLGIGFERYFEEVPGYKGDIQMDEKTLFLLVLVGLAVFMFATGFVLVLG